MEASGLEPVDLDTALEGQDEAELRRTIRSIREREAYLRTNPHLADPLWRPLVVLAILPSLSAPLPLPRGGRWHVDEVEEALLRFDVDGLGRLRRRCPDDLQWRVERLAEQQRKWLATITPEIYEQMSPAERRYVDVNRTALLHFDDATRVARREPPSR